MRNWSSETTLGPSEIGGMSQRDQSTHALQQIKAHGEDGQNHHAGNGLYVKVSADPWKQQQGGQAQSDGQLDADRQNFEVRASRAHDLNNPWGRHNKTSAISTYTPMLATEGKRTLPKVSTNPTNRAAIMAPRTLPMPPITTTTTTPTNVKPSFVGTVTVTHFDGVSDDLLTAGLGASGLASATAPTVANATAPTAAELRRLLNAASVAYYLEDEPVMSDAEYDRLFRELKELETKHPDLITSDSPTQRVAGRPVEGFETVEHLVPMLSLDNAYSPDELRAFDERVRKALEVAEVEYAAEPIPLEEVEPASEIVKRFATGAMSFGAVAAVSERWQVRALEATHRPRHRPTALSSARAGAAAGTGSF